MNGIRNGFVYRPEDIEKAVRLPNSVSMQGTTNFEKMIAATRILKNPQAIIQDDGKEGE